jgi:hypothetical protein
LSQGHYHDFCGIKVCLSFNYLNLQEIHATSMSLAILLADSRMWFDASAKEWPKKRHHKRGEGPARNNAEQGTEASLPSP